jgi:hypothetical protein
MWYFHMCIKDTLIKSSSEYVRVYIVSLCVYFLSFSSKLIMNYEMGYCEGWSPIVL